MDTEPQGCDVLIDGAVQHRQTPCRIDGIPVGQHRATFRINGYKVLSAEFSIKSGELTRLNCKLSPYRIQVVQQLNLPGHAYDMDIDRSSGRIFVASENSILIYQWDGTVISGPDEIIAGQSHRLVAVDNPCKRIFSLQNPTGRPAVLAIDMISREVLRKVDLETLAVYKKLCVTPDGNMLVIADSTRSRLIVLDAHLSGMIGLIGLPGPPNDIVPGSLENEVYVALSQANRLSRIDLRSGTETGGVPTGSNPRGLFWNVQRNLLTTCNDIDKTVTVVDVNRWVAATGINPIGGGQIISGCWTEASEYMLVLLTSSPIIPPPQRTGTLVVVYLPTWGTMVMSSLGAGSVPLEMADLPGGSHACILFPGLYWMPGKLWVVRGHFR